MAFPAVVGTPAETAVSTASTSHVVNLPAGAAGNLLVAIMSKGTAGTTPTVNALTGWTELLDEAQTLGLYIAWRLADGTEGSTTTFTLSSATRGAWIVYEISGAADPNVTPPQRGTTGSGLSGTPDPPASASPPSTQDYLFIAFFGATGEEVDDDTWSDTPPTNYSPTPPRQKACGTAGASLGGMIASAERQLNTGSAENPGTFAKDVSVSWRSQTITVHPAPPPTTTGVAKLSLASGSTPATQTSHKIKVRARVTSGAGKIRAALYESTNNRSGDLESAALTTSLADYTLPISDANAANITDYSNLEIQLWGYAPTGGSIVFEVDQIYLEIPGSSGQVVGLGQLTETDTLNALASLKTLGLGQLSETDSLFTITRFIPGITVGLGLLSETDVLQVLSRQKSISLGQIAESDLLQAFSKQKLLGLGQPSETDVLQTLSVGKSIILGQIAESDILQTLSKAKTMGLGLLSETDILQALGAGKSIALGLLSETDTLQGFDRLKAVALGLLQETDSLNPLTIVGAGITLTLGLLSETDVMQALSAGKSQVLNQISETDALQSLVTAKSLVLGQIAETDALQLLSAAKARALGQLSETDVLQALAQAKSLTLGQIAEVDTLLTVSGVKSKALGLLSEVDSLFAFTGGTVGAAVQKLRMMMGVGQ